MTVQNFIQNHMADYAADSYILVLFQVDLFADNYPWCLFNISYVNMVDNYPWCLFKKIVHMVDFAAKRLYFDAFILQIIILWCLCFANNYTLVPDQLNSQ